MLFYPMKTEPCYKAMPWGGQRLNAAYNKKSPFPITGESWEAADHKNGQTPIANGAYAGKTLNELAGEFGADFLGSKCGGDFPVLFKLIDANDRLSVQVHPDNTYAAKDGDNGKTEMWIVLCAEEGAGLYLGFENPITRDEFAEMISANRLESALCFVPAKAGDSFFLPAGLVHAIGKGLLIAEIQQSSDATYRVYDWGRLGFDGKPRPLHIQKALDVSDTSEKGEAAKSIMVVESFGTREYMSACPLFAAMRICARGRGKVAENTRKESFHIIFVASGEAEITAPDGAAVLEKGDTALIPAGAGAYMLGGDFCAYRFWIPNFTEDYEKTLAFTGYSKEQIDALYKNIKG